MTARPPPEGFQIRGRVVDREGYPLPGVRIHARHAAGASELRPGDPAATTTDEDGTFLVASVVGMHTLFAIDDLHAPAMTPSFDVDRPIEDLEIVMKPGGVYAGRVIDAAGAPVAGARVHVHTVGPLGPRRRVVMSDASGAFEVKGLPRAPVLAYAASDGGVSEEAHVRLDEPLEVRDEVLVLLALDPAASSIAGHVVDDEDVPLAGVAVQLASHERWLEETTSTDARGAFSIGGLPAGAYGLWIVDPEPTMARAGDTAVRLAVPRAGGLSGRVAFADGGAAVQDFTLQVEPASDDHVVTRGEDGSFEVRGLRPGTHAVIVRGPGFLDAATDDVQIEAAAITDVGTIGVVRGRSLIGTVVDETGRGVEGARVCVGRGGVFCGVGRFDEPYEGFAGAVTDAIGAFAILGRVETRTLAASPLVVAADHPAHGRSLPVALPTGDVALPPVTLVLRACGAIAGTVTRDGHPVEGASVGAGWPELGAALTSDDGAFVLARVPIGPVTLRVRLPFEMLRAHQRTVLVEADRATRVTIDLPAGGARLSVSVSAAAGDIAGALLHLFPGTVTFTDYAQLSARLFPDAYGLATWDGDANRPARFEDVAPGDYTLCAIPLAWSPHDQARMKQLREHRAAVKVYGTPVRVLDAPAEQALTIELPAKAPLTDGA